MNVSKLCRSAQGAALVSQASDRNGKLEVEPDAYSCVGWLSQVTPPVTAAAAAPCPGIHTLEG